MGCLSFLLAHTTLATQRKQIKLFASLWSSSRANITTLNSVIFMTKAFTRIPSDNKFFIPFLPFFIHGTTKTSVYVRESKNINRISYHISFLINFALLLLYSFHPFSYYSVTLHSPQIFTASYRFRRTEYMSC